MYAQNLYQTLYLLCLKSICPKTYREEKQFEKKVGMAKKQKENSQPFLFFFTSYFSFPIVSPVEGLQTKLWLLQLKCF